MAKLLHELWEENDGEGLTFCLAGPIGDGARGLLRPGAKLIWTVEAECHFDAMTKYYAFMDWGKYTTDQPWDLENYPDEWLETQRASVSPS
jgi:hypothetical protein